MNHQLGKRPERARSQGITLIELMIVVVIVAILGAIAAPMYQNYVRDSRRAAAQGDIVRLQSALERYFSDNNTYVGFPICNGAGCMFPNYSPTDGDFADRAYDLTLPTLTANGYTIQATPTGGGPMVGDGFLQLTSTGARGWDRDDSGGLDAGEGTWDD